jgi:hypothetical protein
VKKSYTQVPSFFESSFNDQDKPEDQEFTIKSLTSPHSFTKFSKSGKIKYCTVYFSESLQKLSIDKDSSSYILTTDIIAAEKSFSSLIKEMYPHLTSTQFGLKIITTNKTFEFATESKKTREDFVFSLNTLVRLCKEYMSANGLKKYCESIIEHDGDDSFKTNRTRQPRVSQQSRNQLERQIFQDVLNSLLSQVEIKQKTGECSLIEQKIRRNIKERTELTHKQELLKGKIAKQDQEIDSYKSQIKEIENGIDKLRKPSYFSDSSIYTLKIWTNILEFLKTPEIVVIRNTCKAFRRQTQKTLMAKSVWRKMSLATLRPRRITYRLYMRNFYKTEIRGVGYEVDSKKAEEIKNDVWKGLNENQKETEEILLELCKYNPNLDYCQGMHFVSNMLFMMYRDKQEVVKIMDSLCRPPFYLSELWKNDLSRLNLGIYQLEFLLRIRLPQLAKHLKDLDINLSTIVTRWFLTVFTHLHYRYEMAAKVVFDIWDFFLLQGWPALISTCLAFFYLSEEKVLNKNYEETLTVLTSKISCSNIHKIIPLFEIDPRILEDLDGSYATVIK